MREAGRKRGEGEEYKDFRIEGCLGRAMGDPKCYKFRFVWFALSQQAPK